MNHLRAAMLERAWTEEEKAILADVWGRHGNRGNLKAAMKRLPGRSASSIVNMRFRLKIKPKKTPWTEEELHLLRTQWGVESLHWISRTLGRRPQRVAIKAGELGLPMYAPPGWESVSAAADRTGFSYYGLLAVIRWAGIKPQVPYSTHQERSLQRYIVDCAEIDEAVERWAKSETPFTAAKRVGVCAETLRKWLAEAGVPMPSNGPRCHVRVLIQDVDHAVSFHKMMHERTCEGTEPISHAARRVGVSRETLRRYLKRVGWVRGSHDERVNKGLVEKAAELYAASGRAKPSHSGPASYFVGSMADKHTTHGPCGA